MSRIGSEGTSPGTEASDAPHNSLLSELDTSYRILIEKYEALLEAREHQQHHQQQMMQNNSCHDEGLVHPGVDDMSGPMSLVMTDTLHDTSSITLKCQRCHTCTCDLKPNVGRPKSNLEEFYEVETSSSGFSDGESRLSTKSTQTGEEVCNQKEVVDDLTPTIASRCLDLSSPLNPCDKRFQAAPEYKKLFQEIFTVLKKTVDEKDLKDLAEISANTPLASDIEQIPSDEKTSTIKAEESTDSVTEEPTTVTDDVPVEEVAEVKDVKTMLNSEIQKVSPEKEVTSVAKEISSNKNVQDSTENIAEVNKVGEGKVPEILDDQKLPEEQRITHKPPRPDSLDLGNGSRPTSRQKRRRRHRVRLDSYQQHQQYMGQYQYAHGNPGNEANQSSSQSGHRHHRRDREPSQNHHHRQGEDFPTLRNENESEPNKTRIIYNSSRNRCEHHRSRKYRDRSNNRQRRSQQQQNNQDQQSTSHNFHSQLSNESESRGKSTAPKINYPSVEVAKLRKLEMSYAEVLKTSFNRSCYNHRRY